MERGLENFHGQRTSMHVWRRSDRNFWIASQIVDESAFSGASEPHNKNIELLGPHTQVCGTHRGLQMVRFGHIALYLGTVGAGYCFALALVNGSNPFLSRRYQRARNRLARHTLKRIRHIGCLDSPTICGCDLAPTNQPIRRWLWDHCQSFFEPSTQIYHWKNHLPLQVVK